MTFRYRYVGDLPTAFPTIPDPRGGNWFPSKGDTIESVAPIAHFQLELVVPEVPAADDVAEVDTQLVKTPAVPESTQSPVSTGDDRDYA